MTLKIQCLILCCLVEQCLMMVREIRQEEESKTISTQRKSDSDDDQALIEDDEFDSLSGLGGFHGSIHVPGSNPITIYYAVGVYSENLPDGTTNGIPVLDMAWKNVVATFYHELNEARTDPDVGDARLINDPHLGWYSDGIIIPPIKKRRSWWGDWRYSH